MLDNLYKKSFDDCSLIEKVFELTNKVFCIISDDHSTHTNDIVESDTNLGIVVGYNSSEKEPFVIEDNFNYTYATPVKIDEFGNITILTWKEIYIKLKKEEED